jgi:formylglycine-generating enzyme required for sulfatase activity
LTFHPTDQYPEERTIEDRTVVAGGLRGGSAPGSGDRGGLAGGSIRAPGLLFCGRNRTGHEEYRHIGTGLVLVLIPEGEFWMGSDEGGKGTGPVHSVHLGPFLIGKHPVTNAQYRIFCRAAGRKEPPPPLSGWGYALYSSDPRFNDHPVVNVSWEDARAYADWAGVRLPTEAEWERAAGWDAKAGRARTYPWGEDAPNSRRTNFGKEKGGDDYTTAVGACPDGASPCGALDMAGNVWEWCRDWFDESHYASCTEGVRDPVGPESGTTRAVRGGSWLNSDRHLRCAYRIGRDPGNWYVLVGFRVALRTP